MNAYPKKFREKVLEAIEKGHSKKEVAEMFGINPKTIRKWEHLKEETGGLNDKVAERSSYKINRDRLLEYYKNNPHSTNKETAKALNCSKSGVFYAKAALTITRKKTQLSIVESN